MSSSSSAALSSRLTKLMKKTVHHDKDERFMAISDLCAELETPELPPLDPPLQVSLSRSLLPLLVDPSIDVQTISVKALGLLTKRITPDLIRDILDKLSTLTLDPTLDPTRDVYVIGMRTIIAHVGSTSSSPHDLGTRCLSSMIAGLTSSPSSDVTQAALDLCHTLLVHVGSGMSAAVYEGLLEQLLARVGTDDAAVQKRVIAVLGILTPLLNEKLFHHTMQVMLTGLKEGVEGVGGEEGSMYIYRPSVLSAPAQGVASAATSLTSSNSSKGSVPSRRGRTGGWRGRWGRERREREMSNDRRCGWRCMRTSSQPSKPSSSAAHTTSPPTFPPSPP